MVSNSIPAWFQMFRYSPWYHYTPAIKFQKNWWIPYQSGIKKYYTILILDTRYSSSSDMHRYLNICKTFAASQQPCFSFNVQVNTCQHSMAWSRPKCMINGSIINTRVIIYTCWYQSSQNICWCHCIHIQYLKSYIPYHIYHIWKCFDSIMHMVSKFWRTLYTGTNPVSQSGDTSPT
jgi:hypothetical protein